MVFGKKLVAGVAAGLLGLGLAGASNAALSGPFTDSIVLSSTNWNNTVSIPKFDPSLGTLNSIKFTITGHVEGSAKFESLDAEPATVAMLLKASVKLQRPDLSTIVVTLPVANTSDNVTAFDGIIDFGGTSGKTYANLTGNSSDTVFSPPPPSDLALFTGLGNITLPVEALGLSSGSGAGNLILQFSTSASAEVSVTYDYTVVPEPASLSLLAVGAMGLLRRRRIA